MKEKTTLCLNDQLLRDAYSKCILGAVKQITRIFLFTAFASLQTFAVHFRIKLQYIKNAWDISAHVIRTTKR
jgi:hypothetical protein